MKTPCKRWLAEEMKAPYKQVLARSFLIYAQLREKQ